MLLRAILHCHENFSLIIMNNLKNQGDIWDHYVKNVFPTKKDNFERKLEYPGDEWARTEFWDNLYSNIFVPNINKNAKYFFEIGSGSGKQSKRTLSSFNVHELHSFDISQQFIETFSERFKTLLGTKVFPHLLTSNYAYIYEIAKKRRLLHEVDCFYSFDAMVHVDFQHLFSYFLNAALILKINGAIIMDVATVETNKGFDKLCNDVSNYYHFFGAACTKFQFMSKSMITDVLNKLDFEVEYYSDKRGHILFVAKLKSRNSVNEIIERYNLTKFS